MSFDFSLTYSCGFLYLTLSVVSTASGQIAPDAGQVRRELQAPAVVPSSGQGVTPPPFGTEAAGSARSAVNQPQFAIKSVRITGSIAFTEAQLQALIPELGSGERTLAELQQAAARITRHYRQAGYLVARAYLPQQKLEGGAVTIAVLEGKLSDIKVENSSRLMNERVQAFLDQIEKGQPVRRESVDRPVLLLGDVPGVGQVDSRLAAGAEVGDSVLNVRVSGDPAVNGRVELDNHGGLYTGRTRLGAQVAGNSLLGYGERFSGRLLTSNGGLVSGRAGAQAPLGSDGLTVSGGLSRTTYELGDVFKDLDVQGRSDALDLGLRYPLLRSSASNVYVSLNGEQRDLRDEVRSTATVTDKRAKVLNLSLNGDWRDSLGGGGVTLASLTVTSGKLNIDSADAADLDAAAARTAGRYSKWGWSLERQQALARGVTFSASARGQSASKNLDSSEKFGLGGPSGVRAYASGEASGDEGWLASLELRYAMTDWLRASVFHDTGKVKVNAKPYQDAPNTARRSGTGLGLQGGLGDFDWQLTLAWRGSEEGKAEPDKKLRAWAQAGWRF
jgi:hemolysin activation/secretion protein